MSASDSESRLDVASSRIRMRGSARIARAIETRCFWPAGKLHAAFADDRVVFLLEVFREFIDACDAARGENLFLGRVGSGERHVFANRAVEEKRFLQHHAELRAIGIQLHGGKIDRRPPARGRFDGT